MNFTRRHFLRGAGGVTLALPLLEAFGSKYVQAQTAARTPFVIHVVHSNGVVQAGGGDPEWWWPSKAGPLASDAMVADLAAKRATGVLSDYATKLLLVRGVSHSFAPGGCAHAAADAQILSGTNPVDQSGSAGTARANGESVDQRIAREKNPAAGRGPLLLKSGNFTAGGMGYDVPGFVSYTGPRQPAAYTDSPYQAYLRMVGVADNNSAEAALIGKRRHSVNDILRAQIQALLSRKDLTKSDRDRLNQHFAAVRDLEVGLASSLPDPTITSMKAVDAHPYQDANHITVMRLAHELMVFAMSIDYTRSAVLRMGDRIDLYHFKLADGSTSPEYHLCSHRQGGAISQDVCAQADRIQMGWFKELLDKLAAVSLVDGSKLIDAGVTIWTNQQANGNHSYKNIPYVICGNAAGYLKTGTFVDLTVPATTNRMLNTVLNAAGVRKSDGSHVDDFGEPGQPKGEIREMLA